MVSALPVRLYGQISGTVTRPIPSFAFNAGELRTFSFWCCPTLFRGIPPVGLFLILKIDLILWMPGTSFAPLCVTAAARIK